jgi:uncharacterized protein YciI
MAEPDAQFLLLYEYVPDMAERRGPHRGPHLEKLKAEREAGHVGAAGAFDPPTGAAIVFTGVDREHVEAFVASDPYQRAGLVTAWRVERWKLV